MKSLYFTLLTFILLFFAMSLFSRDNTPQVSYQVLRQSGHFEIRQYEVIRYASVEKAGHMLEVGSSGFRDLASYIFGGNQSLRKIAMTAPVRMEPTTPGKTRMSFSMPDGFTLSELPLPNSANVRVHEEAPVKLAILRFSGFAANSSIENKAEDLRSWLRKEGLNWKEPVIFLAYNSPWTFFNRRNEVAFQLIKGEPLPEN